VYGGGGVNAEAVVYPLLCVRGARGVGLSNCALNGYKVGVGGVGSKERGLRCWIEVAAVVRSRLQCKWLLA
jgi:hypothetical protein